jgi:hypothetical protein
MKGEIKRVVDSVSGEAIAWSLDDDDLPPAGGEAHLLVFERSNSDDGTAAAVTSSTIASCSSSTSSTVSTLRGVGAGSGAGNESRSSGSIQSKHQAAASASSLTDVNSNDDELPRSSPHTTRYKTPDDNQNPNPPVDPFGAGMSLSLSGFTTSSVATSGAATISSLHIASVSASASASSGVVAVVSSSSLSASSSMGITKSSPSGHVAKRAKSKDERDDDLIEGDRCNDHKDEKKVATPAAIIPSTATTISPSGATAAGAASTSVIVDEWKARHPNERYNRVKVLRDTLMGLVVLAIDRKNGQQVAIKLSHRGQVEAGRCLENPLKEAETLRRLGEKGGHRHVLSLLHESKCDRYILQ